jgi:penicillin-binding protein 1A
VAEPGDRILSAVSRTLRLVGALIMTVLVVPPVMVAVALVTLLQAPLPAGNLPEERPFVTSLPSTVYDSNGDQIATFRGFDRTVAVQWEEIPDSVRNAVVAIEDQRFWTHPGVDLEGIGRAFRTNLEVGGAAQGGSTITQQYIKNVYLTPAKTYERKVEEALLAIELEKRLSKEEILFGYLTTVYFGDGAYGVGAAAEVYFGKPVSQLDISEAATLAGLVQAPSRLSPRNDLEAAERRRRLVLETMKEQHYLTEEEYQVQLQRQLWLSEQDPKPDGPVTMIAARPPKGATDHPYFVDWVESELVERFGPDVVYQGGLTIETTIDPGLQDLAEGVVADRLEGTEFPVEMSLVSLDPTSGHVVAMVGGRDYANSQVNLATGGSTGFQPGSSFKPLVMAAGFELGIGPETVYAAPGSFTVAGCTGSCTISNYDGGGRGNITIRDAMRASVNTVFAQEVLDVGIPETIDLARRLGLERIDPDRDYGASLALGAAEASPLEMASAYGTFANRGVRVAPTGVLRVLDADGNVLVDNQAPAGERVVDEVVADNVTDVLVGVIESGTGKRARLDRPAAGKTGTAQEYRAAWFVGYTPRLATAVWMGHADGQRSLRNINGVRSVTGGSHPAIAWQRFMSTALEGADPVPFPPPGAIVPPMAESGEEVVERRRREQTVVGAQQEQGELATDCGGRECGNPEVPVPSLPAPAVPLTLPPVAAPDESTSTVPPAPTTTFTE